MPARPKCPWWPLLFPKQSACLGRDRLSRAILPHVIAVEQIDFAFLAHLHQQLLIRADRKVRKQKQPPEPRSVSPPLQSIHTEHAAGQFSRLRAARRTTLRSPEKPVQSAGSEEEDKERQASRMERSLGRPRGSLRQLGTIPNVQCVLHSEVRGSRSKFLTILVRPWVSTTSAESINSPQLLSAGDWLSRNGSKPTRAPNYLTSSSWLFRVGNGCKANGLSD